jgi:hypothetical protein
MSDNTELKKIFGPKWEEERGGWRNLRDTGASLFLVLSKYYWSNRIKGNEVGRKFDTHGRDHKCFQVLVRKPEGRIQLKDLGIVKRVV